MEKEICWNITARCNQSCKYCHRFLNIKDLTFEENYSILNNLVESGVNSITWTGGEALLLKEIDKLIKFSHEYGIKNKIITNGKLLNKERIDKIYRYLDSITLSIDSVDDNTNEELGRGRNHYQEIKDILDYIKIKNYDIKIRINSVVCKNNLNKFNGLIDFLENYNIYSWRIFKFMPLRETAVKNKDEFNVSMKDYNNVIKLIKERSSIKKIDTRIETDMEKKYVLILANGDIVVTENGIDKKLGNALNDSLKKYI
ncbi:MAG: radical SAM protein [Bacilli bacterium]|nr:radical SAM protein [Bacilli bacterium]